MTSERSQRLRRDQVPAELHTAGRRVSAHLQEICGDAALVESDEALPIGTSVRLDVGLPGLRAPVELAGRVIRSATGEVRRHSLALLFSDPSPAAVARVEFYVSLLEAQTAPGN